MASFSDVAKTDGSELVDFNVVLTGVTGSGKSSTCNFLIGSKHFKEKGGMISITSQTDACITSLNGFKVRIIDSPGFCDDNITEKEHLCDLGTAIMLARGGMHAMAFVLRLDTRFGGNEASVITEMAHFPEFWKYMFIIFTHADYVGADQTQQEKSFQSFLSDSRCPKSLKQLLNNVGNRYIFLENSKVSSNYVQIKQTEILDTIQKVLALNKRKAYSNVLFKHAMNLYEKALEKEKSKQADLQLKEAELNSKQIDLQSKENTVISREISVKSKENAVQSREESVMSRESSVWSKENTLQSRETSVKSRESSVLSKENTVQSREVSVKSRESSVTSKESAVQSRETAVQLKEDGMREGHLHMHSEAFNNANNQFVSELCEHADDKLKAGIANGTIDKLSFWEHLCNSFSKVKEYICGPS